MNIPPIHPRLKTLPFYMFVVDSPQMTFTKAYSVSLYLIIVLIHPQQVTFVIYTISRI